MNNPLIEKLLNEGFYGKDFDELDKLRSDLENTIPLQQQISDPYLGAGLELAKKYSLEDEGSLYDEDDVYSDFEVDSLNFWRGITNTKGPSSGTQDTADRIREHAAQNPIQVEDTATLEKIAGGTLGVGGGIWFGLQMRDIAKRTYVENNMNAPDDVLAKQLNKSTKWVRNAKALHIRGDRFYAEATAGEPRLGNPKPQSFGDPNMEGMIKDLEWQNMFEEKWTRLHRISQGGAEVDLAAGDVEWERTPDTGKGRGRVVDPNLKGLDPELEEWLGKIRELPTSGTKEFPPEKPGFKEWSINVEGMPMDVAEVITPEQAEAWRKVSPESRRMIEALVRDQIVDLSEWDVASGKGKPKGSNLKFEMETMSKEFWDTTVRNLNKAQWQGEPSAASGPKVVHTAAAALALLYGVEAFLTSSEDFEWKDLTEGTIGEVNLDLSTNLDLPMAGLKSLFRPSSMSLEERQAMGSNRYGVNMWAVTEFLKGLGTMQMGGEESIENMTLGNLAFALQSIHDPRKKWGIMKEIPQSLNDVLVAPLVNLAKRLPPMELHPMNAIRGQSTPAGQYPPQVSQ